MPSHRILIPPGGGDQSRKGKKEFPSSEKLWVGGGGGGLSDRVLHARNAGTFFFSFLFFSSLPPLPDIFANRSVPGVHTVL